MNMPGIDSITPTFANMDLSSGVFFVIILIAVIGIIFFSMIARYISLWFQAFVSGTPISIFNIVGMSMRKIPPRLIINAKITTFKAGLKQISVSDLETHYLAGGKLTDVVRSMIAADKANIDLDWRRATAIDLAGRDLFDAVRTSVSPKVIDCPPKSSAGEYISAMAKDGVELKCRARVTVRTNIHQLVGGATEETVVARVGEGIVSTIGSADSHHQVLEAPQSISKTVLSKGLDDQTAFEILSIDIADITIGENIGAKLRADRAEADMRVARAKAEERRAMAIAEQQENLAKIKKADVEVPLAIAHAFKKGNLGIFDYQKIKNIQADTQMRQSIANEDDGNQRE
jgi:uncharacterized protein YqfA (UPF0365 family)